MRALLTGTLLLAVASGCQRSEGAPAAEAPLPMEPADARACGGRGQPDCPLQAWMKATLQAYMVAGGGADHPRLATALGRLATAAPGGYAGWGEIARRGAEQARAGNTAGVRQACTDCHEAHRKRFRAEMRGARLF